MQTEDERQTRTQREWTRVHDKLEHIRNLRKKLAEELQEAKK